MIIHKDQKKEWHSYDVFWGRNQFCGRNETEWVEDWITRRTFRFPRTRLPAVNIEVQLLKNDKGELFYSTPKLKADNQERWVTSANVMLEVFGSFWAIEPEEANLPLVISRKVNWTILPCGNQPWPKLKTQLDGVINSMRNKAHRNHAHRSMQAICQQRPSETLIGNGGFRGYVIFCFKGKQGAQDFAVLESIHPNNATYILGGNWESISKLSKSEILNGKLHLDRYIHDREWSSRLEQLFLAHAA